MSYVKVIYFEPCYNSKQNRKLTLACFKNLLESINCYYWVM